MNWQNTISWRFLINKKKGGLFSPLFWISFFGIGLCLGIALVSVAVLNGFEKVTTASILKFNAHLVVLQQQEAPPGAEFLQWLKKQDTNPLVAAYSPYFVRQGLAFQAGGFSNIALKGVDFEKLKQVYPLDYQILKKTGSPLPEVIVGHDLFKKLFATPPPSQVTLHVILPKSASGGEGLQDMTEHFTITGHFKSGLYEFDSQVVLMDIAQMHTLFDAGEVLTGVEFRLRDYKQADFLAHQFADELPYTYQAISWTELNESLFAALKMEKNIFLVVMILIMIIACFNVAGLTFMMILGREQDMAILKAMGAPPGALMKIFSVQGLYLVLPGCALGVGICALLLWCLKKFAWLKLDPQVYFMEQLPLDISVTLSLLLLGVTLVLGYGIAHGTAFSIVRYGKLTQKFR